MHFFKLVGGIWNRIYGDGVMFEENGIIAAKPIKKEVVKERIVTLKGSQGNG
jgi:hypothetical protein